MNVKWDQSTIADIKEGQAAVAEESKSSAAVYNVNG